MSHIERARLYGQKVAAAAELNGTLQMLANVYRLQGRFAEATRFWRRALAFALVGEGARKVK